MQYVPIPSSYKYQCSNNSDHLFEKPTGDFWCPLCDISSRPMLIPIQHKREEVSQKKIDSKLNNFKVENNKILSENKDPIPDNSIIMDGEMYTESWFKRVWNTPLVMTDEYLKIFFPDVDKLRYITSIDSVNALRRFINLVFAKKRNWINIGNQGFLKLDDGSSISIGKITGKLQELVNLKKSFDEIANDLPVRLANGDEFRKEMKRHLGHIKRLR
jgi:uncharacterized Zn finger protein (UPF0148 family)